MAVLVLAVALAPAAAAPVAAELSWPLISQDARPWSYWWWMGSAVDRTNLTKELTRYRDAGWGGVHIIPIYGAKGWETNYIPYLSPQWMKMLSYTVTEGKQLGLGVDMTTGTGWCFGGPKVTDAEANASVVARTIAVEDGGQLQERFDRKSIQALMAFSTNGAGVALEEKIQTDGSVAWTAPKGGPWRVFSISQKPSGQKVKRAAPGGEGPMLNLLYPPAMRSFLDWFDEAFKDYTGPKPGAQYHDSYEYRSDWSPDFFAHFQKRRGYGLQNELPALFGRKGEQGGPDRAARVKCDYRETVSDIMAEESLPLWVEWSHRHAFRTRNEAHGSPGNLLDLYALADIPETEMFYRDRNKLISKFASSAAHVAGRNLVGSETGTWLNEHFTETLADMKYLLDDLFVSGVNHVLYHGTCYSPDEAGWPGWVFYASFEMNPRNSIWRDVPALNQYVARCQSVLQSGTPDNDVLVYWPIHDFWQSAGGLLPHFTVHARDWFEAQPIGKAAEQLWTNGFAFDYASDRQLAGAKVADGMVTTPGGQYRAIVVPQCELMPPATFEKLLDLARDGANIIFEDHLPKDVPGWGDLEQRRARLQTLLNGIKLKDATPQYQTASLGKGWIIVADLKTVMACDSLGLQREFMTTHPGLFCIRRAIKDDRYYFIANRGGSAIEGWVPLGVRSWNSGDRERRSPQSVIVMDPMTGRTGPGTLLQTNRLPNVYLQLQPGESVILRASYDKKIDGPPWDYWLPATAPTEITGNWRAEFISGGPVLPPPIQMEQLASWAEIGDEDAQRFAGTAKYMISFNAPASDSGHWMLDLGKVCQSARLRLNGKNLGTLLLPPFRVVADNLRPAGNLLEIEVTNVSANRIRDLDRRGVKWKSFRDINFVNLSYQAFDASNWKLKESGLLGPVSVAAVARVFESGGAK